MKFDRNSKFWCPICGDENPRVDTICPTNFICFDKFCTVELSLVSMNGGIEIYRDLATPESILETNIQVDMYCEKCNFNITVEAKQEEKLGDEGLAKIDKIRATK